MDQISPVGNLLIQSVESCSWDNSSPRQSPGAVDTTIASYSEDENHHLVQVVNVETAPSESGGSLCDALTPGGAVEADQPEDILIPEYGGHQYTNEDSKSTYRNQSPIVNAEESQPTSVNVSQLQRNEVQPDAEQVDINSMASTPYVEPGKKDPRVHVSLEGGELWRQFLQVGTEMIITRSGRYV